ncbi:MAG TPA: methyltransferase domain-containing protein [Gaiellaceae bacterium]|nr:methyltransferase domain-containing protein [Gaiellaceae bacterium]
MSGYDRFLDANAYVALAHDLVAALNLPPGGSMLDVGCGSGAVALAGRKSAGATSLVVGLDPSHAMLRRAVERGVFTLVRGALPALPFRDGTFDRVAASLVLSHVEPYAAALRDMARVLARGGRLAVTAGARSQSPTNRAYQLWMESAEVLLGRAALDAAIRHALPHEAWFADAAHVVAALAGAGLEDVEVEQREYGVTMATEAYFSMLDVFAYGRFVRAALGAERWHAFRQRVRELVDAHCGLHIEYTARYHIGVGSRRA